MRKRLFWVKYVVFREKMLKTGKEEILLFVVAFLDLQLVEDRKPYLDRLLCSPLAIIVHIEVILRVNE